jgi:hypothetical protein
MYMSVGYTLPGTLAATRLKVVRRAQRRRDPRHPTPQGKQAVTREVGADNIAPVLHGYLIAGDEIAKARLTAQTQTGKNDAAMIRLSSRSWD